ncbi:MAG: hypothetical protein KCHDKBKB_01817 [Elusimicrobia bacterium]|nr:hypothetical protein [Elusimicrobiota bacterium]
MNLLYHYYPNLYTRFSRFLKGTVPTRQSVLREYFRDNSIQLLQIGAGTCLYEGWCHGDIDYWNRTLSGKKNMKTAQIFLDLEKPFPFVENTFDAVYSSHVHEHFPYRVGERILAECFRILKPGAQLRIVVPKIEYYFEKYMQRQIGIESHPTNLENIVSDFRKETGAPLDTTTLLNTIFLCHGHRMLYDFSQIKD